MSKISIDDLMIVSYRNRPGRYDARGLLLDIVPESDDLVISCSGIVPKDHIIYAMENTSQNINTNKIFICDSSSSWYYNGIPGMTSSFGDTVYLVEHIVNNLRPKRICAIGTSSGAYMSIALTAMLGFDRSLGMSPQTSLDRRWREENGDDRWGEHITRICDKYKPYDLSELIETRKSSQFHVVYPGDDELDIKHAERLSGMNNVHLYRLDGSDHNPSAELKRRGVLHTVIESFISGNICGLSEILNLQTIN